MWHVYVDSDVAVSIPAQLQICEKTPRKLTRLISPFRAPSYRLPSRTRVRESAHASFPSARPRGDGGGPTRRRRQGGPVRRQRRSGPGYSRRDSRPRVHGGGERPGRRRRRGRQARRRWRRGPGWRFIPSYSLMAPRRRQEGDPLPDYGEFLPSTYC